MAEGASDAIPTGVESRFAPRESSPEDSTTIPVDLVLEVSNAKRRSMGEIMEDTGIRTLKSYRFT